MDIIESVKAAEEKAENIKSAAKIQAQKLLADSEKNAKDEAQKIISDAKEKGDKMYAEAMLRADAATQAALVKLDQDKEQVIAIAKKNNGKAVDKIISLI